MAAILVHSTHRSRRLCSCSARIVFRSRLCAGGCIKIARPHEISTGTEHRSTNSLRRRPYRHSVTISISRSLPIARSTVLSIAISLGLGVAFSIDLRCAESTNGIIFIALTFDRPDGRSLRTRNRRRRVCRIAKLQQCRRTCQLFGLRRR